MLAMPLYVCPSVSFHGKFLYTCIRGYMNSKNDKSSAFVLNFDCRYGRAEFWDDLKKAYQMCGVDEREVAFLLTDSQVVNEVFLEDISNILNSGEVPGDKFRSQQQRAIYIWTRILMCQLYQPGCLQPYSNP